MSGDYYNHVLVLVATLNEEQGIKPTLEELQQVLISPSITVVDGHSADRTAEIAKKMGARVLMQEGKGKGDAIFQGIRQIDSEIQYVVFIDADFTYPAEYLPQMIDILDQNEQVGMVIGNRFKNKDNQGFPNNPFYVGNRLLAFAQHVVNGIKLEDPLSGLRVVRREILEGWKPKSEGFDVEAEMNYLVEQKGFGIIEFPIKYRARLGEKKLKLRHGFGILKRIISESFYT